MRLDVWIETGKGSSLDIVYIGILGEAKQIHAFVSLDNENKLIILGTSHGSVSCTFDSGSVDDVIQKHLTRTIQVSDVAA